MRCKILSLMLMFVFLFSLHASAQTVDEIIKKNIEAQGGYNKLKSIKTAKMTGSFSMPMMGIEGGAFSRITKRPNLIRMDMEVMGMQIVQAYDGKTAWQTMPSQTGALETTEMSEDDAKEMERDADFDGHLVDYKKKGYKVELIGKEDMEGTEVYHLKVTLKDGHIIHYYIDTEYFLELKTEAKTSFQGREVVEESFLSDYKEADGLMVSHSLEIRIDGQVFLQITMEKIELNVDVEDDYFKMPAKEASNTEK